jgi:tetratricopeptide (TPR) repeat protein
MRGRATTDEAAVPNLRRFEIVRALGSGGMGVVYEAIDRVEGRRVAIKTKSGLGPDLRLRFKNEFRALQGIHHDNLVRLGELFEEEGQLYYTMELVRGVPFLEYVRPSAAQPSGDDDDVSSVRPSVRGRQMAAGEEAPPPTTPAPAAFDEKRLRSALAQLASGLDALHRAGRVHRDIKSSNVLVTAEGRLVILDFGLIADASAAERETGVVGTAHFMAPEQAAGRRVGQEADWYAVGVLLYVALTGQLPFHAAPDAAMSIKQRLEPQPPGRLVAGLPPDLTELCVGLLRRDPAERISGVEAFWRLTADEEPDVPRLVEIGDGFVGRERELEALASAFAEARRGEGVVAVVEGESGIGKSALLARFLDALGPDALVFRGRCHERDTVPYKAVDAIIDALRRHLASLPADAARAMRPAGAAALETVFPELGAPAAADRAQAAGSAPTPRSPIPAVPVDPQTVRADAFAALRELLRRVAEDRPLCLAIDDLHWADADSLQLLAEITRPPGAPRLLLVTTARAGHPVALPFPGARRVALGPLPAGDAAALVGVLVGRAEIGDRVDAAALAEEASGHPLFLDALVRHRLAQAGDGRPVRLDEAIWSRVERLGAASRRLVEVAAVAGVPLDLDDAARVTATSLDEVVRALVPAQGAHLVRVAAAAGAERLEPFHDRVRETVLSRLDAPAVRAWHARIAIALEASGRAAPETLSVHWRGAGEPARAAAYAERAGDEAAGTLAFDRAARLYALAIDLRREALVGGDDRALRVRLAAALDHAGREAEAARAYLAAAEGAPGGESLGLIRHAAGCFLRAGYVDEGLSALRWALGAVGLPYPGRWAFPHRTGPGAGLAHRTRDTAAVIAEIAVTRAAVRLRGLDFVPRREDAIDPRTLARVDVCWEACSGLAFVDSLRATAFQGHHLRLALDAGEPRRLVRALGFEAILVGTRGEPAHDRALDLVARAEAAARRAGDPRAEGQLAAARGSVLYLSGRFRAALGWIARAEASLRRPSEGAWWERASVGLVALWCHWFLGDLPELCSRIEASLRGARERGDRLGAAYLRLGMFNVRRLVEDDPARAQAEAEEAFAGWSANDSHVLRYHDLWAAVQRDLYTGPTPRTFRVLAAGLRDLGPPQREVQIDRVIVREQRARVALACADRGFDRRAMLARALADARALEREPAAWARPHAFLIRAGAAAIRGARAESAALCDRAARGFEAVDMALYAAAARRRWGEMLGGEDGRAAAEAADAWMRAAGVVRPDRMAGMLAPGFGA